MDDDLPEAGQSRLVRQRREMLGGKGADRLSSPRDHRSGAAAAGGQ